MKDRKAAIVQPFFLHLRMDVYFKVKQEYAEALKEYASLPSQHPRALELAIEIKRLKEKIDRLENMIMRWG